VRDQKFLPSKHGFHFSNRWPDEPNFTINIPLLGAIPVGNAANGMCGGMVYAALDYFLAGQPIPTRTTPPDPKDPLFQYIYRRLLVSFDIPFGVLKYYTWMAYRGDLVRRTVRVELPAIQAALPHRPVPIGFIRLYSRNPMKLGQNHQVLVHDLTKDGAKTVLHIYDNNYADDDHVTITCDGRTLVHSLDGAIRGLFPTRYEPRKPA
jgi:hypothetical protein